MLYSFAFGSVHKCEVTNARVTEYKPEKWSIYDRLAAEGVEQKVPVITFFSADYVPLGSL